MLRDDRKAVVLLSGGLDSATALAIAKAERYELYALSFNYGQRHGIELESAKIIASVLDVKKHLITTFDLREIGGSALTANIAVPKNGPRVCNGIPATYVPARNTIFLSFALAWAEVLGADNIFIGANAIDYSGYPDCRPEFLRAFEDMANLATKASVEKRLRVRIRAPLLSMSKAEIILKGSGLGLDYSMTWSCYDPQPSTHLAGNLLQCINPAGNRILSLGIPCGSCDSCRLRRTGFREAGIADPLEPIYNNQAQSLV